MDLGIGVTSGVDAGGRLRVIATVQDPAIVREILARLARTVAPAPPAPAALT